MSFNEFSKGSSGSANNYGQQQTKQLDTFSQLCDGIRGNIFAISGNITSIQRMTANFGTDRDTQEMRDKLHALQQNTQDMIKNVTNNLKSLSAMSHQQDRIKQLEQQKLTRDFQVVLDRFQQLQRLSAEKSREFVARAKVISQQLDEDGNFDSSDAAPLIREESKRQQELIRLDNEIEYNEGIIMEREQSIKEIEGAIHEVNEMFRDLGSLVVEQQGMIDNIESNIESTAVRTGDANLELQSANTYQRKAKNRMCYLFGILAAVLAVLIIILVISRS